MLHSAYIFFCTSEKLVEVASCNFYSHGPCTFLLLFIIRSAQCGFLICSLTDTALLILDPAPVHQGNLLASIDLKDAYLHVLFFGGHQRFLGSTIGDAHFQFGASL